MRPIVIIREKKTDATVLTSKLSKDEIASFGKARDRNGLIVANMSERKERIHTLANPAQGGWGTHRGPPAVGPDGPLPRVRKVRPGHWRTEYDRPIYFVELRDGYLCSWCELQGAQLIVIPHPLSPRSVWQYEFPRDAVIVGQVTGVALRIVDSGLGALTRVQDCQGNYHIRSEKTCS
jgi:hypothetical protein